jgi:DNA-binding beta-propeller fold protein YncE
MRSIKAVGVAATAVAACAFSIFAAAAPAAEPGLVGEAICTPSSPCGELTSWLPESVAVNDETGDVYVIDRENDSVEVFSAKGAFKARIGGSETASGDFHFSASWENDIAVDNSGGLNQGNVYIVNEGSDCGQPCLLLAFDQTGALLWEKALSGPSSSAPCGVAVDPSGSPWVADYYSGLQKRSVIDGSPEGPPILAGIESCHIDFTSSGQIALTHWTTTADLYNSDGTELLHPLGETSDVAIDRGTDEIYAPKSNNTPTIWSAGGEELSAGFWQGPSVFGGFDVAANSATHKVYVSVSESPKGVLIYNGIPRRTLAVEFDGGGSGSVSADFGPLFRCTPTGGRCVAPYGAGATIVLAATPDPGSAFAGWSGGGCSGTGACEVVLSSDLTVTALFEPAVPRTVSVSRNGAGTGSVASLPPGIDCGETCAADFDEGSRVTLTAAPAPDSVFIGWSGAGCGGAGTCVIDPLAGDESVIATFAPRPLAVEPGEEDGTQGAVTPPPPPPCVGAACPAERELQHRECVKAARAAFRRAKKAAFESKGRARVRRLRAARKQRHRALAGCRATWA